MNFLKAGYLDIVNFFRFRRSIKKEVDNPNSEFNKFRLKTNKLKNIIYKDFDISENEATALTDNMIMQKIIERLNPINLYFQTELVWAEYLSFTIWHYTDEERKELILSYRAEWKYYPFVINTWKFWLKLIGLTLGIVAIVIFLIHGVPAYIL